MFGMFLLYGLIALSTSALCVYTVDRQLSTEYEVNSHQIAQAIANGSLDIILNRDLSALQTVIDQFRQIHGIKYIYIADDTGELLAHTFVPGIPPEIASAGRTRQPTVQRRLAGMGDFVEVSSPIMDGLAGSVHVGMDKGVIALKIQTVIGQQVYLISIILLVAAIASYALMNMVATPMVRLTRYAAQLAVPDGPARIGPKAMRALLERKDEVGQLARIMRYLAVRPAEPE
jgi:sensor histidine kinase regulating citrate/malate metabolism